MHTNRYSAFGPLTPTPQSYGCTDKQLKRLQRVCGIREGARPLDRQYLFNVYTHPSSSYKGAAAATIAAGVQVLQSERGPCQHLVVIFSRGSRS